MMLVGDEIIILGQREVILIFLKQWMHTISLGLSMYQKSEQMTLFPKVVEFFVMQLCTL